MVAMNGFVMIADEDMACVLMSFEKVQAERDGYREVVRALRRRIADEEEHF